MRVLKEIASSLAARMEFGRSMIWGLVGAIAIIVIDQLVSPFRETFREWWGMLFDALNLESAFYPGLELPLTVAGIYLLGRILIALKNWVLAFALKIVHKRIYMGTRVIFELYPGRFSPGVAGRIIRGASDFPYEYLVQIFSSPRGLPDGTMMAPDRVWVINGMPEEDFMKLWGSSALLAPESLPPDTIRWNKWMAQQTQQ